MPVSAVVNGAPYNPTSDVVQLAFMPVGAEPATSDWKTGSWETKGSGTSNPSYYARCLVGPNGTVTLAVGSYVVWVKITDSPEIPVSQAGTLQIV